MRKQIKLLLIQDLNGPQHNESCHSLSYTVDTLVISNFKRIIGHVIYDIQELTNNKKSTPQKIVV